MANCNSCTNICNCTLFEDGYFSGNHSLGRNFTTLEGSGTAADPFTFHFLDQNEFRPKTAELIHQDISVTNNTTLNVKLIGTIPVGSVLYESPIRFLVDLDAVLWASFAQANYFAIGCSVTFAETADLTTKAKQIYLTVGRGTSYPYARHVIAGQTVAGGGGDPMTLSCQGYTTGLFNTVSSLSKVIQEFDVYVFQDSGADINLTDIRIWITQI